MLEIERKWLLLAPPSAEVVKENSARTLRLKQTYLQAPTLGAYRTRKTQEGGVDTVYEFFKKVALRPGVNEENSYAVTRGEYLSLLERRDRTRASIEKVRSLIPYQQSLLDGTQVTLNLELDMFQSPRQFFMVELELPDAELLQSEIILPAWLGPVQEVTTLPEYSNAQIALL